jgi:hypothetical protein
MTLRLPRIVGLDDSMTRRMTTIAAIALTYNLASSEEMSITQIPNALIAELTRTFKIPLRDTHSTAADPENPNKLCRSPDGLHADVTRVEQWKMRAC